MLIDKPLTQIERDNAIGMLIGCKNRLCITDDVVELLVLVASATQYIHLLAQSRYLELKDGEK